MSNHRCAYRGHKPAPLKRKKSVFVNELIFLAYALRSGIIIILGFLTGPAPTGERVETHYPSKQLLLRESPSRLDCRADNDLSALDNKDI